MGAFHLLSLRLIYDLRISVTWPDSCLKTRCFFNSCAEKASGTLRQALKTDMLFILSSDKVFSVTVILIRRKASCNCFLQFTYITKPVKFLSHFSSFHFIVNILFHCLIFYKIEIMTMQRPSRVKIYILMVCQILLLTAAVFACVYIIQISSTTPSSGKLMIHKLWCIIYVTYFHTLYIYNWIGFKLYAKRVGNDKTTNHKRK